MVFAEEKESNQRGGLFDLLKLWFDQSGVVCGQRNGVRRRLDRDKEVAAVAMMQGCSEDAGRVRLVVGSIVCGSFLFESAKKRGLFL